MIPAVSAATGGGATGLPYLWVTAGSNGELYTTTSTTVATGSWTSRTSSFGTTLITAVASNGNSLYVAGGELGKLATSPDGTTWTQRTSGFSTNTINDVAYGDGYWVAVGNAGTAAYSTDGTTWTTFTSGLGNDDIKKVAWGNGLWIMASFSGMRTATIPTGTWTSRTSTISTLTDLLYFKGQSIWVACGDTGTSGNFASSSDGISWSSRNSAFNITGTQKYAANSTVLSNFSGVGVLTIDCQSSTNGATYTDRTPATTSGIAYEGASDDAGLIAFIAGGMQTSTDAITWTLRTLPSNNVITITHSSGTPSLR